MGNKKIILGENDFQSRFPDIAKEWDYDKNGLLLPTEVTAFSNKKVWWKCSKCGYEWEAKIGLRSYGRGCPSCAQKSRNKALSAPKKGMTFYEWCISNNKGYLLDEWDCDKNKDNDPKTIAPMSDKVVWWKCDRNHSWEATIKNRTRGTGCPVCSSTYKTSFPEQAVLFYLSKHYETESRIKVGGYEVDILLPLYKIGVEYDGKYYHKNKTEHDDKKTRGLKEIGIDLIRIKEGINNIVVNGKLKYTDFRH